MDTMPKFYYKTFLETQNMVWSDEENRIKVGIFSKKIFSFLLFNIFHPTLTCHFFPETKTFLMSDNFYGR